MKFIRAALSEKDGTPSSQRCALLMLLVFTLNLIACGFYTTRGLPVIPDSLSDMIKWLFGFCVLGIGAGKFAPAKPETTNGPA